MGLRKSLWLIIGLCCLPALGQEDSTYVKTFPDKISIRARGRRIVDSYRLSSLRNNTTLNLTPNARDKFGWSVQFRSLEIGFDLTPRFLWRNGDLQGSRHTSASLRIYPGRWAQEIELYYQRGFIGEIDGVQLTYPDFRTTKVGGSTAFVFNRNFSYRALTSQHQWQLRSAGSFVPRLSYYYTHFNWDFNDFGYDIHSYDLAIGPGYQYNWVVNRNLLLSAGANLAMGANLSTSGGETLTSALYEAGGRVAIGYNSKNFFTGLDCNLRLLRHNERRDVRVDDNIAVFEIYIGYRLEAPRKWIDLAEKLNKKLPL